MKKPLVTILAAGLLAAALLAGCSGGDAPIRVGLVTDTGGIDDRSFNATIWKGIQDAQRDLGIEAVYRESRQATDYAPNLQALVDDGSALVVAAGGLLSDATRAAALAHPDRKFAIVDASSDQVLPNLAGLSFRTDEAALLAGYLAAGMSKTGRVGTFGGLEMPAVTMFMVGLEAGVARYAQQKGKNVQLLGWTTDFAARGCGAGRFAGGFNDTDANRRLTAGLIDEGADVVVPVAGSTGFGTAQVARDRGAWVVGVDSDQYVAVPEYQQVYLTSILKNSDRAVYDLIQAVVAGRFTGGTRVGTLANGGVGLAPFHDADAAIPSELKAELARLRQDIVDGRVESGWNRCAGR